MTVKPEGTSRSSYAATGQRKSRGLASPLAPVGKEGGRERRIGRGGKEGRVEWREGGEEGWERGREGRWSGLNEGRGKREGGREAIGA